MVCCSCQAILVLNMFHLSLGQFLDCNRCCQVSTHHLQTIVVIAVVTSVICWRSSLPEFDTTYSFLVLHNVSCMTLYGLIESLFSPPMITYRRTYSLANVQKWVFPVFLHQHVGIIYNWCLTCVCWWLSFLYLYLVG